VFPLVACNLRHFLIDNAARICKNPDKQKGFFLEKNQESCNFFKICMENIRLF